MEPLGTALLAVSGVFASLATMLGLSADRVAGRLRASVNALHASSLLLVCALACLAYSFFAHDFALRYVADYSDRTISAAYLLAGVWAGQSGSLLLWAACTAATFSIFVAWRHRHGGEASGDGWLPALGGLVVLALVVVVVLYSNPFQPMMRSQPMEGVGLNGLLRNPLMAVHPPVLFIAYALAVIPALLAVTALVRGDATVRWVQEARPYALLAWGFLGVGNLLGMLWAYEELGWGGYWGWDPVENASLLPWLASTAYLHVAAVAERRGVLQRTAMLLAFFTMILPLFGTYLTRSGVVASQHAFAESPASGAFLVLIGVLTAGCVGLLVWRWRRLGEGTAKIESLVSREAGAALTALLFVVMILAMTAATMAPLLGKLFGDEAVQIEPAGYVRFMGPLATILLFLTAVCPLLAYRRTDGRRFLGVIGPPGVVALGVLVAQLAAGDAIGLAVDAGGEVHWFAVVAFALGAFVVTAALSDIVRGIVARARSTKESLPVAARWFVLAGRRRAGSDLVHVGAALMLIGFGGASYQQSAQGMLRAAGRPGAPGASMDVGDYRLTYLGPRENATPEYDETQALVRVDLPDGGAYLATPSLRTYRTGSVRDTAEVAILAGVMEDVYVEVRQFPSGSAAFVRAHVNPLTWFVWAGSIVLFAGMLLGLWPGRRAAGRAGELVPSLRRARSFGLLVALLAGVVAVWEGGAQAALVVGGATLLAALWAGGLAVKAWAAPTVPGTKSGGRDGSPGGSEADRPPERLEDEIAVEKLMGRWGER